MLNLEQIVREANQLPIEDRVRLIQIMAETLTAPANKKKQGVLWRFGAYSHGRMSTEEDFKIAEWRPTDEELDG